MTRSQRPLLRHLLGSGAVLATTAQRIDKYGPIYMLWTKRNLLLPVLLALSACAVTTPAKVDTTVKDEPSIISVMPEQLESFDYQGYRYFDKSSDGFTMRYSNLGKHRLADVFIYPVSKENQELPHDQLVMGSTRATIQAIGSAVKTGQYANFNVIGAATKARGIRTVARVEATYLRENLASYTLVYQTEYDGTLIKVRVSMPDNTANRSSEEWDRFASSVFDTIIDNIQGKDQQILATKKQAKI